MIKQISIVVLSSFLLACSFHWQDNKGNYQHRGFISYELTQTNSVQFYELQTIGFQLRMQPNDRGVTFGYRKYIALQPPLDVNQNEPKISSGFFISEENISNDAALLFKKQLGMEAGGGLLINGVSLGYDRIVIIEGPPKTVSIIKKIDYNENNPLETKVYQSTGDYVP